ncbi:hypothetical protein KUTeg_018341, partial [Tegillarca granosa]
LNVVVIRSYTRSSQSNYVIKVCQCDVCGTNITASSDRLELLRLTSNNTELQDGSSLPSCWFILDTGDDEVNLLIFISYRITCPQNSFNIYSGLNNTGTLLVKNLCGTSSATKSYSTSQRFAYLEVASDGTEEFEIKMEYIAANDKSRTGCQTPQILQATYTYQYLSSPNFPEEYSSNSKCRWLISNPDGLVDIEIIVADIEGDDSSSCEYDKYEIHDGEYICENNAIEKACAEFPGILAHNVTSTDSFILVTFKSDDSVNKRGFYLRFKKRDLPTTTRRLSTVKSTTLKLIEHSSTNNLPSTSQVSTSYISESTKDPLPGNKEKLTGTDLKPEIIYGIAGGCLFLITFVIVIVIIITKQVRAPISTYTTPPSPSLTTVTDSNTSVKSRKSQNDNENGSIEKINNKKKRSLINAKNNSGFRNDIIRKHRKDFEPPYATVIPKTKEKC